MKLVFVYNAEAGLVAGMLDSVHKLVSPSTYACDLCAITYGVLRMDPRWKAWLEAAPFESAFYHRADFRAAYPSVSVALPAVLLERGDTLMPLIAGEEFEGIESVDALIAAIEMRLPTA